jgi:uncharacterized protein YdaU (DUF1376 family)
VADVSGQIHYVRLHLGDLLLDSMSLDARSLGAYLRLYMAAVRTQRCIADTSAACAQITGLSPAQWRHARAAMMACGIIESRDGELYDRRADHAIAEFRRLSASQSERARKRWQVVDGGLEDADR